MGDDSAGISNHWVHSHEEDVADVEVYRSADHPFPPSRGRRGFDLRADGRMIYFGIGPTDRPTVVNGTWSLEGGGRILLRFDDPRMGSEALEIVSNGDGVLKVRATTP